MKLYIKSLLFFIITIIGCTNHDFTITQNHDSKSKNIDSRLRYSYSDFMLKEELVMLEDNFYELITITCLEESTEFGTWFLNQDTIFTKAKEVKYKNRQYGCYKIEYDDTLDYVFPDLPGARSIEVDSTKRTFITKKESLIQIENANLDNFKFKNWTEIKN